MTNTPEQADMTDTPITHPLSPRLRELSEAVTKLPESRREFTMRVPAEPDRDADLVLSRAAFELDRQAAKIARLRAEVDAQRQRAETAEAALRRANDQAEHFEREWYLRGDALEALRVDAERYRHLRESATVRSDCGQWAVSIGADWLPVSGDAYPPMQDNTEAEECPPDVCDAAIDAARAEGRSDG